MPESPKPPTNRAFDALPESISALGPNQPIVDHRAVLFDLVGSVVALVKEAKRDPAEVMEALRVINDHRDFARRFGLSSHLDFVQNQLRQWQHFYYEHCQLDKAFTDVLIPPREVGFDKLLVVAKEVGLAGVVEKMNRLMPVELHIPRLSDVISDRPTGKDYAVWIKGSCEASEEYAGLSFNDFQKLGVRGITLLERLLCEMEFFSETKRHMDAQQRTLCSGSWRSGQGFSISVYWVLGRLRIRWCDADYRDEALRARRVIF